MKALKDFISSSKEENKNQDCGGQTYSKLKYSKQDHIVKKYLDDYDHGTIDEVILFEISMGLD
jgi:hypothetical protein